MEIRTETSVTKRTSYADNLVAMYNDIILHFSDESSNLIHGFEESFIKCSTDKNPKLSYNW